MFEYKNFYILIVICLTFVLCDETIIINDYRKLDNSLCKAINNITTALNHAKQSFIFRCRPGDDCGGVGDRLGGVMGGALFSILTGRSYRVYWPGLSAIFKTGPSNWTYDIHDLGISTLDSEHLDSTRIGPVEGGAFYKALDHNHNIAIINDLNAWILASRQSWGEFKHYDVLFLHSNRGTRSDVFTAVENLYHLPKRNPRATNADAMDYYDGYRCIFHGMFHPSDEFLQSSYTNINGSTFPFINLINIINDPSILSIAVHYRIDDGAAEGDSQGDVIKDDLIDWIIGIGNQYKNSNPKKTNKINFYFITNSKSSGIKIRNHIGMINTFHVIYSQQLSGDIHVNKHNGVSGMKYGINDEAVHSLRQAWKDWWIMMLSDVLICLMNSGFCKTAGLMAPLQQIKYEEDHQVAPWWCGNRYC